MRRRERVGTFTVLEIADRKTGRKRRTRPELTRVPTPNGSFFYVLRMPRRSDPEAAFRLAARCAPVILTALPIPPDTGARLFEPRVFPLRRAAAVLCSALPLTRLPPQKLSIGALDPEGALRGGTDALIPLASDVRIVTRDASRFDPDAAFIRRRFGASLTVGEDVSLLANCDAVVCAAADTALADVPVILSCEPADGAFSPLPVRLPQNLARLCPPSVSPDLFAAALAEKCGLHVPELYACTGAAYSGECLNAAQTASLWQARIKKQQNNFS